MSNKRDGQSFWGFFSFKHNRLKKTFKGSKIPSACSLLPHSLSDKNKTLHIVPYFWCKQWLPEAGAPAVFHQPDLCTLNPALPVSSCRNSWLLSPWGAHHVSSSGERGRGQRGASHRHVGGRVTGRLGSRWAADFSVTGVHLHEF